MGWIRGTRLSLMVNKVTVPPLKINNCSSPKLTLCFSAAFLLAHIPNDKNNECYKGKTSQDGTNDKPSVILKQN